MLKLASCQVARICKAPFC